MTWEYKTITVSIAGFMFPKFDAASVESGMNELGREGWELVTAFDTNAGAGASYQLVAIFKRPITR
jgi:hypothetical protein